MLFCSPCYPLSSSPRGNHETRSNHDPHFYSDLYSMGDTCIDDYFAHHRQFEVDIGEQEILNKLASKALERTPYKKGTYTHTHSLILI